MAIYIPPSRRRRRTIVIAVGAAVVGLVAGLLIARLLRPSVDDEVDARRGDAEQLVARLDGLALEYRQTGGAGQAASDARTGSLDAARAIAADAGNLLDRLPWLAEPQRATALAAVDQVRAAIEASVSVETVTQLVDEAEAALRAAVGLAPS